jgi:peptide/nickel transport system substrate-binding protein
MKRDLRALAAVGALLAAMAGTDTALAQKQGGILRMSHFDSPASMSMHEEATGAVNRPMMGVFNNLVMYKQDVAARRRDNAAPAHLRLTSWCRGPR